MTRDEIIRMAAEVEWEISGHDFPHSDEFIQWCERFAALVAAHEREKFTIHAAALVRDARQDAIERERDRRAFEIAECYRCGWDSGSKNEREKIAQSWDALHEQYMADPLRRQMMLSYEMVARMIRGRT